MNDHADLDRALQQQSYSPAFDEEFDDEESGVSPQLAETFRGYLAAVVRNRRIVLAVIAVVLMLGAAITMLTPPTYRGITTVQVDREADKVLNSDTVEPVAEAQEEQQFLATQVDILKSRQLAIRVAQALGLTNDDRFLLAMGGKPLKDTDPAKREKSRRNSVLAALMRNLSIDLGKDSRVVGIWFDSPDPDLSARVANAFADNYIKGNLERRFASTAYARDFLNQQLSQMKDRLARSERDMITYARRERLIDASDGDTATGPRGPKSLTTASLVQLNTAQTAARAERMDQEQRWDQARTSGLFSLPEVLANQLIQDLVSRRTDLQADYDQRLKLYKPDYPAMRQTQAQIANINGQINQEADNIRDSIRQQYMVALKQETAITADEARLMAATLDEQGRSVQFNILKREVDTDRTLYDGLLERYKEVGMSAGVTANNLSVVDVAEAPNAPIRPRPLLNMILALLLGTMLGMGAAIVKELFDDAVNVPEDVRGKLGLPLLGSVPLVAKGSTPRDELRNPASSLSEAYYSVRTALQYASAGGAPRRLLITSGRQSEGKSTTAIAIALDFARIGKRVLLIDGDMRKPSIHRVLSLPNTLGFSSVLTGQRTIEEAAQVTPAPNLAVLTSGPRSPSPAELLASPVLATMIEDAASKWDCVVIDGPPVLGLADAPLLGGVVDGVVIVVQAGGTHRGNTKTAVRRLQTSAVRLFGVVLTKFDPKASGYGYGNDYGYLYSYSYGKGKTKSFEA